MLILFLLKPHTYLSFDGLTDIHHFFTYMQIFVKHKNIFLNCLIIIIYEHSLELNDGTCLPTAINGGCYDYQEIIII